MIRLLASPLSVVLEVVWYVNRHKVFSHVPSGYSLAVSTSRHLEGCTILQHRQRKMLRLMWMSAHSCSSARFIGDGVNRSGVSATMQQPRPPLYSSVAADTSNDTANTRRKYFWTQDQLVKKTEQLIAYSTACTDLRANRKLHRNRQPLATEFFQVLEAWMEQCLAGGGVEAANKARSLLRSMLLPQQQYLGSSGGGNANKTPAHGVATTSHHSAFMANILTSGHYDVVLQAYAVSGGGAQAAEQAEALLLQILAHCRDSLRSQNKHRHHHYPPEPTIKTFNIMLNCWAKSGASDAAEHATRLMQLMEEWNMECQAASPQWRQHYIGCWANEISLVSLIEAWTNSKTKEAPEQALALLQEVMFVLDSTDSSPAGMMSQKYRDVDLDVVVFNAVIYAWVRSDRGRKAAWQAEEILQVLIQWSKLVKFNDGRHSTNFRTTVAPNTRTYAMVIMAWAECESREQSGYAAQRAEKILWKMVQLYRDGNDVKPNAILATMCITAWSRAASTCAHAPEQAEKLWALMHQLHTETGHADGEFEPTTKMGNAVISAWARCTSRLDSVPRALESLEKLKDTEKVDLISYNTILDAMSKRGMGEKAMNLLYEMESARQNPESLVPWPDLWSYNSVLAALSRANSKRNEAAEEAERLLKRMDTLATMDKSPLELRPDRMSYTSVINAWSRSDSLDKVQRAMVLVQDMIRQFDSGNDTLRPDVVVYTILIKACAHCFGTLEEKQRALTIAIDTMQTLETTDFGPPNDIAYATFMGAIFRLSESTLQRESILEETFRSCAARGYVSKNVVKEMDRGGSRGLFRRLTNNTNKISSEWSSNVAVKDRPLI